jgi:DNA-binding NarL/FixJ family response regulator
MSKTIKILLADDEILFRKSVSFLLQKEENIKIVFEASNGNEIIDYLESKKTHPDIILMDLKMPDLNGVEATKIILKEYPKIKIIALTSYSTKCFIANMIKLGAVSYLVKSATPAEVIETINEVHQKGYFYDETVMNIINNGELTEDKTILINSDETLLSEREKEILRLICFQLNSTQIAEMLEISARTVENHRLNLLVKTRSRNIAGMVVYAIQNKIINLDELDFQKNTVTLDFESISSN